MTDTVNSPPHYQLDGIETIEIIEAMGDAESYCYGNIVKYVTRARSKGNEIQDLKKARWYLNRLIERAERKETSNEDLASGLQELRHGETA